MSEYNPDKWVVLKFSGAAVGTPLYKVFAGWYGGYTHGDSWKMNSGITRIEHDDGIYRISGASGSTYSCPDQYESMSVYMTQVYYTMLKDISDAKLDVTVEVVPIESILKQFSA